MKIAESAGSTLAHLCVAGVAVGLFAGCTEARPGEEVLSAGRPLHLEEHLDAATFTNEKLPDVAPTISTARRQGISRRTLRMPTPGRLEYRVTVPEGARLDVGLALARRDNPITFRVGVRTDGEVTEVFHEEVRTRGWAQRSVDLSSFAGRTVTLALAADSATSGEEALWATPTLSGATETDLPNVVLYVIDAAGAEYMSLYGYNRRTTPNLARLAAEGAVFERAYSNSTWTKVSTPTLLSSLHSSSLGGLRERHDKIPDGAVPLGERLHAAGYQTALFTSNPFAGIMTGLERGIDTLVDRRVEPKSGSSEQLHRYFWRWRDEYPARPFFVHVQTTDVHWPWKPLAPFAGMYTTPDRREEFYEWERQLAEATGLPAPQWLHGWRYPPEAFEATGIDKRVFFEAARGLYDETMTHNDHQIGRLVKSLKESGEWEHTLFIVASDHGSAHGLGLFDPVPLRSGPLFNPYRTRIPLIVVWPGRIPQGQRIEVPVSMIDLKPTILDLVGLSPADVQQGRSLVPLLTGRGEWRPTPVVLDEFYVDKETGELGGWIEIIDGRWGASLRVYTQSEGPAKRRSSPLLLYDLVTDPYCLRSLHGERPDLVEKYESQLESLLVAHRALAPALGPAGTAILTEEQLEDLRALGYIQ